MLVGIVYDNGFGHTVKVGEAAAAGVPRQCDHAPDVAPPTSDLRTANYLGRRVTTIAGRFDPCQSSKEPDR